METQLPPNSSWLDNLLDNTTWIVLEHPGTNSTAAATTSSSQEPDNRSSATEAFISKETSQHIQWIFALIIIPCVCLPGILGNVSSMVVLYRHGFKKTSNILLAALTLADVCYLIGVNNVPAYVHDYSKSPGFAYSVNVCYFLYGLYRVYFLLELWGNWCSLTLPVLITLERIVAVYFPFKFPVIVTTRRTCLAVLAIFILWLPINVYYFFLDDLVFYVINGQQRAIITRTRLYTDTDHKRIYLTVSRAAIFLTEPVSVLIVIAGCVMVGTKIRAASLKRLQMISAVMSVTHKPCAIPSFRTTWTLMLVCIVYTITIGSAFFIQVTVTTNRDTALDKVLDTLVRFVKCLHSSCNFFIYIYANRNFRETYRQIFGLSDRRRERSEDLSKRAS